MGTTDISGDGSAPWEEADKWFASRTAKQNAAHLLPYLKPGQTILDIGCGLGSITKDLAAIVAPGGGTVLGTDPDARVIGLAQANFGALPNIKFEVGNVFDLAHLDDETFDVIHAHQVLLHVTDPVRAIRDLRRVLKPGGVFSSRDAIDFHTVPESPILNKQWQWLQDLSKSKGTDIHGGLRSHIWVHDAGFDWSQIESGLATIEFKGAEGRKLLCEGVRHYGTALALQQALATQEELEEIARAWDAWSRDEAGRSIHFDGTVLAWKE